MTAKKGAHLARSGTADIYAWGNDGVLKLYRSGCNEAHVNRELLATQAAHAAGVKTPSVTGTTLVEGRFGIIFERVGGPTMLEVLAGGAKPTSLARQLAALHVDMHRRQVADLPSQRAWLRERITGCPDLTSSAQAALLAQLEHLPGGATLCHGDFQPGNIILADAGPIIIDWFDATFGSPEADVVQTGLLIRHAPFAGTDGHGFDAGFRTSFLEIYLQHYSSLGPLARSQLEAWAPVVAAARLPGCVDRAERGALLAIANGTPLLEWPDGPQA